MTVNVILRRAASSGWLAIGLLATAACAARETTVTTYTLPQQSAPSWVGVPVEDVMRLWGQPAERTPDGEGGTIMTYRGKSAVKVSASTQPRGGPQERNPPGSGHPDMAVQPVETEIKRAPSAVFYISSKGVVYRYTIDSSLLVSGKAPDPPPVAPAEAPPDRRD